VVSSIQSREVLVLRLKMLTWEEAAGKLASFSLEKSGRDSQPTSGASLSALATFDLRIGEI
jgi:hypothetical protein